MNYKNTLLIISGPTAIGKTSLSIDLATKLKTEIISADSRQFYKNMNIGTAKPSEDELLVVQHYFINTLDIEEDYNAGQYSEEVLELLPDLFQKYPIVIMTGGSGLYIKAVTEGLDILPEVDPAIRKELSNLFNESGIAALQQLLKKEDPSYYKVVDKNNPQRLIRALEICLGSGQPYSSFRKMEAAERSFNILHIGLDMDRKELYERINKRVDKMIEEGLVEEARKLYPLRNKNALQTVGYQELFDHFDGKFGLDEAIRLIKRNTRRFAKRQLTWLRKQKDIQWFSPRDKDQILQLIQHSLTDNPQ